MRAMYHAIRAIMRPSLATVPSPVRPGMHEEAGAPAANAAHLSAPLSPPLAPAEVAGRLADLLERRTLHYVFQPIADIGNAALFGYEALMRAPDEAALGGPESLLRIAREHGRLVELECHAALGAMQQFGALCREQPRPGKLFLNLSAPAIEGFAQDRGSRFFQAAVNAGIAPSRLIFELTEHERVEEPDRLQAALDVFTAQGVGLALDDFGDGRSSLRLWAQLQPNIVKVDKYFIRDIHRDSRKVDVIRSMHQLAERFGALLVAEGVESTAELAVLRDLGCGFVQGYLIGKPAAAPALDIAPDARDILSSMKIAVLPNTQPRPDLGHTVERLLVDAPSVGQNDSNDEVRRLFATHPSLHAIAVVEGGYPVGLIDRRKFVDRYAQPFYHELYGRRSCTLLMNPAPFRVERTMLIDSMVRTLAGDDQRYLFEGFIITDAGRYVGLATGESLVRAVTERRIEAARHANPLTLLPGNIPITEHIRRLLDASARFAACYFDLNNFKPYNDLYGYWRGDEMIKLAATVILENCDPAEDFVGHVGGDDFVVLFQSDDWIIRSKRIVGEFNRRARALFDDADLLRGSFQSEDRQGRSMHFPLTSIAAGAISVARGQYTSPEEVASAAASAKKTAKQVATGFHYETAVPPPAASLAVCSG